MDEVTRAELDRLGNIEGESQTELLGWPMRVADSGEFVRQYKQFFVDEMLDGVKARENTSPLLIDCGANVGTCCAWFGSRFPGAQMVAIEPDPAVLRYLKWNAKHIGGVQVVDRVAWTHQTRLNFAADGVCGSRVVEADDDRFGIEAIQRSTIDLRTLVQRPVTLLKMDVEGAERLLLTHIRDELANFVDYVHVEVHEFVESDRSLPEILATLASAGFDYHLSPLHLDPRPFARIEAWRGIINPMAVFAWKADLPPTWVETGR